MFAITANPCYSVCTLASWIKRGQPFGTECWKGLERNTSRRGSWIVIRRICLLFLSSFFKMLRTMKRKMPDWFSSWICQFGAESSILDSRMEPSVNFKKISHPEFQSILGRLNSVMCSHHTQKSHRLELMIFILPGGTWQELGLFIFSSSLDSFDTMVVRLSWMFHYQSSPRANLAVMLAQHCAVRTIGFVGWVRNNKQRGFDQRPRTAQNTV